MGSVSHHGGVSVRVRFTEVGWDLLDIIFSPRHAGCGSWGKRSCTACHKSTQLIDGDVSIQCGIPTSGTHTDRCDHCLIYFNYFHRLRSLDYFEGPIRRAIRELKFQRNYGLAISMGQLLTGCLQNVSWEIDLIVPVPPSEDWIQEQGL